MNLRQIKRKYPLSYKVLHDHIYTGCKYFYAPSRWNDIKYVTSQIEEPTWMIMESLLKDVQMVEDGLGGVATLWEVEPLGVVCCDLQYLPTGFKIGTKLTRERVSDSMDIVGMDCLNSVEKKWLVWAIDRLDQSYRDIDNVKREEHVKTLKAEERAQLIRDFTGDECL
jgi:hypothetical protein